MIFSSNEMKKAFAYKFLEGPLLHCQKFLDLKSLHESSNLYQLFILIIKMGGLFRFSAKAVRKLSKSKNEK